VTRALRTIASSISNVFASLGQRIFGYARAPERRRRIEGIRSRLGMAMALALIPFILLGLAQARGEYQRQTNDLKADLQLAAQRSANSAENLLGRTETLLSVLGPEATGQYCSTRLNLLAQRMPDIVALYRLDADGTPLCSSNNNASEFLGEAGSSSWFKQIRDGHNYIPARLLNAEGQAFIIQAYRVERPAAGFEGAMVAVIALSSLEPDPAQQGLPPGSRIALYNGLGNMLSATQDGRDGNPASIQQWIAHGHKQTNLMEAQTPSGQKRFYAIAPLGNSNAYAVLSSPAASPWFWAQSNPIRFLMMPLAACLTVFAAVMFASERIIIRWLDYLDRIAAIYAKGRYTVRPIQAENAPLEIRHLAQTMDELGDNITKRDAALTEALNEKDALLREIHHRVKNNLQIISSLLSMQQRVVADPAARAALGDTRQRISALALIYRTLYQGQDVRHADAQVFLHELVGHLVSAESLRGPLISSSVEADPLEIDPEKLAPMALWLVEALSNAQKHAFAGRGGDLKVRFKVNGETSILEVEDDGPGVQEKSPGVGITLMAAFAKQLRGTAELVEGPNGGSVARLTFATPHISQ